MTYIPNFKARKKKQNYFISLFWLSLTNLSIKYFIADLWGFFTNRKNRVLIIGLVCLSSAFIFTSQCKASIIAEQSIYNLDFSTGGQTVTGISGRSDRITFAGIGSIYDTANYVYSIRLLCTLSAITNYPGSNYGDKSWYNGMISDCPDWEVAQSDFQTVNWWSYSEHTFIFDRTINFNPLYFYTFQVWQKNINPPFYTQAQELYFQSNGSLHNSPNSGAVNQSSDWNGHWYVLKVDNQTKYRIDGLTNNAVYWAGVGSQVGLLGEQWDTPFYWNVCDSYDKINALYANSNSIDTGVDMGTITLIHDKSEFVGAQLCSGIAHLTGNVKTGDQSSGMAVIELYADASSTFNNLQSSQFIYQIKSSASPLNYIDPLFNPPFVITSHTGTSTLPFFYDFTGILNYASSSICLFNEVSQTQTDFCTNILFDKGSSTIQIPNLNSNFDNNFSFVLVATDQSILLKSIVFNIHFRVAIGGQGAGFVDLKDLMNSSSSTDPCAGLDVSTNDFGFPNKFNETMLCFGRTAMNWAFTPDPKYINKLGDSYADFQHKAPFSFVYSITNAITSGINDQELNQSGNLSVPFIKKTSTSTEYYMIPVVNSSTMPKAIGNSNTTLIRNSISWIMWIAVAIGTLIFFFKK